MTSKVIRGSDCRGEVIPNSNPTGDIFPSDKSRWLCTSSQVARGEHLLRRPPPMAPVSTRAAARYLEGAGHRGAQNRTGRHNHHKRSFSSEDWNEQRTSGARRPSDLPCHSRFRFVVHRKLGEKASQHPPTQGHRRIHLALPLFSRGIATDTFTTRFHPQPTTLPFLLLLDALKREVFPDAKSNRESSPNPQVETGLTAGKHHCKELPLPLLSAIGATSSNQVHDAFQSSVRVPCDSFHAVRPHRAYLPAAAIRSSAGSSLGVAISRGTCPSSIPHAL
ncbi:hypothetical protein GE09DRAFT_77662 [Coniochaeta sp. 2T2.1]|nr:hypothetical protein GE09DRAFT_77662 [Coniochaeta sp. 2T2.1]